MNRSRLVVAAYMLAVFLGGIIVGAFGQRLYTVKTVGATARSPRNADEFRRSYVAEMRGRLELDDQQVQKLNVILDETRDRFKAFKEQHKDEMKAIHDTQIARINEILNANQRAEYERFRAERDKWKQEKKN
jgi:uncharacterized protein YeaO (DUF488 family)